MIYIVMAIAGLLAIVALFTFLNKKKEDPEPSVVPDAECCGAHAVCEKGLKKLEKEIVYFEDEELDPLRGIAPSAYDDDQIEMFRDILYTLRQEEIEDWLDSLEKRGIALPDILRPEALDLIRE